MFDIAQLKTALFIDKNDLDEELIRQPSLFWNVGNLLTLAVSQRDGCKNQIEEATAELDSQFRRQAQEAEEKITETAIRSKIEASVLMQKLKTNYLALKLEADQLQVLREAFTQRAYVLKDLVSLYVAGYFAQASAGAPRRQALDDVAAVNKQQAGKIRRLKAEIND